MMAMDAIVATFVDGGGAIVDIDLEASRNKSISHLLYKFILNPLTAALTNPCQRGSQGWHCSSMDHGNHVARQENSSSWGECLWDVCFARKKSSEQEFFVPAGTHT
jgi:hypothetical protein